MIRPISIDEIEKVIKGRSLMAPEPDGLTAVLS